MSSKARRVKTLPSTPHEDIGYYHREHRARKNRKSFFGRKFARVLKQKIELLKIKELEYERHQIKEIA